MKIYGKKLTQVLLGSILIVLMLSCSKHEDKPDYYVNTPIAGFGWQGNDGPAPVTIKFHNSSENADTFNWEFGDGGTSTAFEPEHTYHNSGTEPKNYLIVLTATDSHTGLNQKVSRTIQILPGN